MVQDSIGKKAEHLYCNPSSLVTDYANGEIICSDCGHVVIERLEDQGKEWRSFTDNELDRSRAGQGTSLAFGTMRLSTIIGSTNKDFSGKPFSYDMRWLINRLRMWDSRSKNRKSREKNLYKVFFEFEKLKDKIAVSDAIIENAALLYRSAMEKGLTRGRNALAIVASCLYVACRESEMPRTLDEIAIAINAKRTDISASFRLLVNELALKLPTVDLSQYVVRIANNVDASERVKRYAIEILRRAEQINITAGKDPMGLAAAAVYLAAMKIGERHSQSDIAEIAKTTTVTIRNRTIELRKKLQLN